MYRYTSSLTLKLTNSLLQKVATFYTWDVKQKDDEMDQNTLHCGYGNYATTNQQTYINKRCCRDFVSLPCHIILKVLFYFQSVLITEIRFLTFSFLTTALLDVLDKSRYQHNTSYSGILFSVW